MMMKNNKDNAIILLSGGLDSLVTTAYAKNKFNIKKALHFDYGQKPAKKELEACRKICEYYNIELEIIKLDWLEKIIAQGNPENNTTKSYWIPNRNALFANIAACFAEALDCKTIIIGANKEEAKKFKDNSKKFIKAATKLFSNSTQNCVNLYAPLVSMNKEKIIKTAFELKAPLELVWSCYENNQKHCGVCPSCLLLKNALIKNNKNDLQKMLF